MNHLFLCLTTFRTVVANRLVLLRWNLLLIAGFLSSSCVGDLNHIYTAGSYRTVPGEGTSVFVWAEDPTLRKVVQTWLRGHKVIVLDATSPRQEVESCAGCERMAALSQARSLKAEQVVLAYSSQNKEMEQLTVSVQSLFVQDEQDAWRGMARGDVPADVSGELLQANLRLLACHTLATVWRYRPAGYLSDASKDYCYFHL
ncbi:MAG: hypothetical protein CV081_02075 [Nitrospira sp. LK265]|nr:hypothetical protein [Nitrospira sp. LK265]